MTCLKLIADVRWLERKPLHGISGSGNFVQQSSRGELYPAKDLKPSSGSFRIVVFPTPMALAGLPAIAPGTAQPSFRSQVHNALPYTTSTHRLLRLRSLGAHPSSSSEIESMMSAKAFRSRFAALRALASVSVDGHLSRPSELTLFEGLNAVGSRPARLAKAAADIPPACATVSIAAQICL